MDDRERLHSEDALAEIRRRFDPRLLREWEKCEDGDLASGLLAHLRDRDHRRILFDPDCIGRVGDLCAMYDPEETAWENRIADNAVEGLVYAATNPYCDRFTRLPQDFDFRAFDHPDPQAIMGLNRHRWYASLARSYHYRGERRYFDALMREWDFYCDRVPFPDAAFRARMQAIGQPWSALNKPPHMELDIFIRLVHWYWAFWLALFAGEMTPVRCAILLARCLRLFDTVAARGVRDKRHNFTSMQYEGIYLWAAALPEATGMEVWRHHARNVLESSLGDAVWPDGTQWEMSPSYHDGCAARYGIVGLLGRRMGEPFADEYYRRLAAMAEVIDVLQCPDGSAPPLSDADRKPTGRQALAVLHVLFPDLRLRRPLSPGHHSLWISGGETWNPASVVAPKPRAAVLPQGGYGAATSSAGARASHAILDNGPNEAGHAHWDNLAVYWEAFGRPALTDPGRYLYVNDDRRTWVFHAESHNTVVIEDTEAVHATPWSDPSVHVIAKTEDQRVGALRGEDRGDHLVLSTWGCLWRADPSARVERTVYVGVEEDRPWMVAVDRIGAPREHRWTASWLLPGPDPVERAAGGFSARLSSGTILSLALLGWDGMEPVRDGKAFWTPNYGEMEPARWLRLSGRCTNAVRVSAWAAADGGSAPEPLRLAWRGDELEVGVGAVMYRLRPL